MKAILMSINAIHNANIESGDKTNELRTRPPKILPPFKVYTYESGALGRHKVVNEWICDSMTTWLIYMGIPAHLITTGCVSAEQIRMYTDNGNKDLTAMHISDLVIYDKPRELGEFYTIDNEAVQKCENRFQTYYNFTDTGYIKNGFACSYKDEWCSKCKRKVLTRPPQSWCYVESEAQNGV